MNELDLIKLNIYEEYENGEITEAEKEYLLEKVIKVNQKIHPDTIRDMTLATAIHTGTIAGISALLERHYSITKVRRIYDNEHVEELTAAKENGTMSEYIKKREETIKAAVRKATIKGAAGGAAVGLLHSGVRLYNLKDNIKSINSKKITNSIKADDIIDV